MKRCCITAAAAALILCMAHLFAADEPGKAVDNATLRHDAAASDLAPYWELQKLYEKWRAGLFGGKKFHEYMLKEYLKSLVGREFRTDFEYYIVSPADPDALSVMCTFDQCRWLYLRGSIDRESLKKIIENDPDLLNRWWRSTVLLSVRGVVRGYRLGKDPRGDTVELFFKDMRLSPIN